MTRLETLHILSGTIATLDDAQLSELYAYAVHMTRRGDNTGELVEKAMSELFKGVQGMFAEETPAPKRIAKRKRKVSAK